MEKEKKKKGLWAAIRESMTQTGGCCGGGGSCCGPSDENDNKPVEKDSVENRETDKK